MSAYDRDVAIAIGHHFWQVDSDEQAEACGADAAKDVAKHCGSVGGDATITDLRAKLAEAEKRNWTEMVERYRQVEGGPSDAFADHMVCTHDGEFVKRTDFLALAIERDRYEAALRRIIAYSQGAAVVGVNPTPGCADIASAALLPPRGEKEGE